MGSPRFAKRFKTCRQLAGAGPLSERDKIPARQTKGNNLPDGPVGTIERQLRRPVGSLVDACVTVGH